MLPRNSLLGMCRRSVALGNQALVIWGGSLSRQQLGKHASHMTFVRRSLISLSSLCIASWMVHTTPLPTLLPLPNPPPPNYLLPSSQVGHQWHVEEDIQGRSTLIT